MEISNTYSEGLIITRNRYLQPFPKGTKLLDIEIDIPTHAGPYKGAIDFIVANGTQVLAPFQGTVLQVVDTYDVHGEGEEFQNSLNYITLAHPNGEFSQLAHLRKGSVTVKPGDIVNAGDELAVTGLSGQMDKPHLHFFVFVAFPDASFRGLAIQFES